MSINTIHHSYKEEKLYNHPKRWSKIVWQNSTSVRDKISQQTRNRRELPQTGKRHLRRTCGQSTLTGKRPNAFVTVSGTRQGGPLSRFLFDIILEVRAGEMRSEQKTLYVWERNR